MKTSHRFVVCALLLTSIVGWSFLSDNGSNYTVGTPRFNSYQAFAEADIRLEKTTNANIGTRYGITIPFNLRVSNDGAVDINNVSLIDYIPSGFTFDSGNNPGWVLDDNDPDNVFATFTSPSTIAAGEDDIFVINLILSPSTDTAGWNNRAEILGATDVAMGMVIDDPDPSNNIDSARVSVHDMALRKELTTPAPYAWEDDLIFSIWVFNQGNEPVQDVQITDYKPEGYLDDLSAGSFNQGVGWGGTSPNLEYTFPSIIEPGDSAQVLLELTLDQEFFDGLAWDNYAEITEVFSADAVPLDLTMSDSDSEPGSNNITENMVRPGDAADDDIFVLGPDFGETEDDHDPAGLEIFDLALRKESISSPPSYSYTQNVEFEIIVFNQGNIEATNVNVTDYIPCGLTLSASNSANWVPDGDNVTWTIPSIAPATSERITIEFDVDPCFDDPATGWTNAAEVTSALGAMGESRTDIDSNIDDIEDNDAGGTPLDPTEDNNIDGDSTQGEDEDDHDVTFIEVFDLALKKELITPPPYAYGDDLTFRIKVFNQGDVVADSIRVVDYVPDGFAYDQAVNGPLGWDDNFSVPGNPMMFPDPVNTIDGRLIPGDSVFVDIVLTYVQAGAIVSDWYNYAQILFPEDTIDNNRFDDADSFPLFETPAERSVVPGDSNDDNIQVLGPTNVPPEDEDDHDVAGFNTFDLALVKTVDNKEPTSYDDELTFKIKVINQGSLDAEQVVVADTIPAGFTFDGPSNPGWNFNPTSRIATILIPGPILIAQADSVDLILGLECTPGSPSDWTNIAEIASAIDPLSGLGNLDVDSPMDQNFSNDIGGTPDSPEDNHVDDDGTDVDGDGITDEDNHDPERIRIVDLALRKTVTSAPPYAVGTPVTFTISVFNQGNETLENVVIGDYKSVGYALTGNNPGWTDAGAFFAFEIPIIEPGNSVDVPIEFTILGTGTTAEDYYNFAEVISAITDAGVDMALFDMDSNPGSDGTEERAVQPGDSADNDITSKDRGGEEDDHDVAGTSIFDLAIDKERVETGPFAYGDPINFTITVENEGTIIATNIDVVDYIPCGFMFDPSNEPLWSLGGDGYARTTIAGPLLPGQTDQVTITLIAEPCLDPVDNAWLNATEITGAEDPDGPVDEDEDSDFDDNPDDDDPDLDDDYDEEPTPIIDLALIKTYDETQLIEYGSNQDFVVTVVNQGNVPLTDILLTDYISDGYSFVDNNGWTAAALGAEYTIPGRLNRLEEHVTTITLVLEEAVLGEECLWINYAEITSMSDTLAVDVSMADADSQPGSDTPEERTIKPGDADDDNLLARGLVFSEDQDDHDPAGPEIFDLSLTKSIVGDNSPYTYGEQITYNIVVTNEGSKPAIFYEIVDYLPCGLDFQESDNLGWDYDPVTGYAKLEVEDDLAPGQMATFPVIVTVVPCEDDDADLINGWRNQAEISEAEDPDGPGDDPDSDPDDDPDNDDPDEDDNDDEDIPVIDLALRKTTSFVGSAEIDAIITYDFLVVNQANTEIASFEVIDYLSEGYIFDETVNVGWTEQGTYALFTNITPIAPGGEVAFSLDLTVAQGTTPDAWLNYAEITTYIDGAGLVLGDVDADSQPGSNTEEERNVLPGDPDDNNLLSRGPFFAEDQDDFDPEIISVVGKVTGMVTVDENEDGLFQENEERLSSVEVQLRECNGDVVATAFTDDQGVYLFENLIPGVYQLSFTNPDDGLYAFAEANVGGDDTIDSDVDIDGFTPCFEIFSGQCTENIDAALVEVACFEVGGEVWYDIDPDNIQHFTENGINGLVVQIWRVVAGPDILEGQVFTGRKPGTPSDDGYYKFCVRPGFYYIKIFLPPNGALVPAIPNIGFDETTDSEITGSNGPGTTNTFEITGDEEGESLALLCEIDGGFHPMATIGNLVWIDEDGNGLREPQEARAEGVKIEAYDIFDNKLAETYTNVNGEYSIQHLQQKEHYLKFSTLPGMSFTHADADNDETIDSDVNHANGPNTTSLMALSSGEERNNVDAGLTFSSLPVEWLYFRGVHLDGENVLSWSTASEVNAESFQVMRRAPHEDAYTVIGEVAAAGTTSEAQIYKYTDEDVRLAGTYYYKLKQVDYNGAYSFSNIVAIDMSRELAEEVVLYPNPAVNFINIQNQAKMDKVEVIDMQGKKVATYTRSDIVNGRLSLDEIVSSGQYHFTIYTLDNQVYTQKVLVLSH